MARLVLFDGECGACNRFVGWILERDRRAIFRFAPLQGETGRRLLGTGPSTLTSMVLLENGKLHYRSDAVLHTLRALPGGWALLGCLLWIPRRLRDPLYDLFARNRFRFGSRSVPCRVLSPDEKARFLH